MGPTTSPTRLSLPLEPIAQLCRRFGVERLDVFGSVLRDDFRHDSDVDFLVLFGDDSQSLTDFEDLRDELQLLVRRKVDLVSRNAVERSRNYLRRRHILSTARPVYVEG
jgi:predicted nucleotidyltransferase